MDLYNPQLDKIKEFCLENNIKLIEDGSHAFGSKFKTNLSFKNSFLAGISLFPTKTSWIMW